MHTLVRPSLVFFFTIMLSVQRSISFITFRTRGFARPLYSKFLEQVEDTIRKVNPGPNLDKEAILKLPALQRESVGVANRLSNRIKSLHKNNDCPTCWLQRAHCICSETPTIDHLVPSNVNRVFMLMHHKEIGLVVDTAKVLLNAMPEKARLVVNGIDEEYQETLRELNEAINQKDRRCIVLFPTDDAQTFEDLVKENKEITSTSNGGDLCEEKFDVIVMDGTWNQARKIHSRYIPSEQEGGPKRVCLSQESLDIIAGINQSDNPVESFRVNGVELGGSGRQLRRHPIKWKEVSTLEATRLLLKDMSKLTSENLLNEDGKACHDVLADYQLISDAAAVRQLGPPREKC